MFKLGRIVVTTGAQFFVSMEEVAKALERHRQGDWGDVSDEQKALNAQEGEAIRSSYLIDGERIHIITDPGQTTVCIAEDL
ncbi:plasmid related protein [Tautonia plasticadhaerens]|uniref:Uncharacterized protein n=1 Tax=Tautonia plasticadhaerens TaxID=2527974 RepID=A0A518H2B1_9BACT|nr:plasmid related protein [Tautonia plasticadhaerens]QDV34979.1 hypothetical protein ElP_28760 [Tautonia plasticadhaerens]